MTSSYFSLVPNLKYDQKPISYPFSESDFVITKNFFKRFRINSDVFDQRRWFIFYRGRCHIQINLNKIKAVKVNEVKMLTHRHGDRCCDADETDKTPYFRN